jgi:hypothetical protein
MNEEGQVSEKLRRMALEDEGEFRTAENPSSFLR